MKSVKEFIFGKDDTSMEKEMNILYENFRMLFNAKTNEEVVKFLQKTNKEKTTVCAKTFQRSI